MSCSEIILLWLCLLTIWEKQLAEDRLLTSYLFNCCSKTSLAIILLVKYSVILLKMFALQSSIASAIELVKILRIFISYVW